MEQKQDLAGDCILASAALLMFFSALTSGVAAGRNAAMKEAVQYGAAEWAFDADGERVFRWKGEPDDAE